MGEGRHESDSGTPLGGGDAQPSRLRRPRRHDSVEIDHQERPKGRRRLVHGPNQWVKHNARCISLLLNRPWVLLSSLYGGRFFTVTAHPTAWAPEKAACFDISSFVGADFLPVMMSSRERLVFFYILRTRGSNRERSFVFIVYFHGRTSLDWQTTPLFSSPQSTDTDPMKFQVLSSFLMI